MKTMSEEELQSESQENRENYKKLFDGLKNEMTKEQIAKGQALAAKCWESEFQDCD